MNRAQLQRLAQIRLDDAQALLVSARWPAAYYLAGYAVECALKSCVLQHVHDSGVIFSDPKYLQDLAKCWTHDFRLLIKLAGLTVTLGTARATNPALDGYWKIAEDWSETSRYEEKTELEAKTLYGAVIHNPDGVFLWIQQHW